MEIDERYSCIYDIILYMQQFLPKTEGTRPFVIVSKRIWIIKIRIILCDKRQKNAFKIMI